MDDLRPRGPGRFVIRVLAIASALGFLTLVMVQAMAFYAPPQSPKPRHHLIGPATKAAPVINPPPLVTPEEPAKTLRYQYGTKAGILGPLKLSQPARAPNPQAPPHLPFQGQ